MSTKNRQRTMSLCLMGFPCLTSAAIGSCLRFTSTISTEQAIDRKRKLKARALKEIRENNFRDNTAYEREKILRLSEQVRMRARKEPTEENCLALVDTIDGILKNELQQNVIISEHGANCPCCGKFFNQDHAARQPRFCESCGAMLVWKGGGEALC